MILPSSVPNYYIINRIPQIDRGFVITKDMILPSSVPNSSIENVSLGENTIHNSGGVD